MKKIRLNWRQIGLLLKVSMAGYGFHHCFERFLEENKELPEDGSIEIKLSHGEIDDILEGIQKYLDSDSLSDHDFPSDKERNELQELFISL